MAGKKRGEETPPTPLGRLVDETNRIVRDLRKRAPSPRHDHSVLPAMRRSDYKVGDELGRGGMGTVTSALHVPLGRQVAIKELQEDDPELEARFVREMLITARLQHPGIITIYEAGRRDDGKLAYTMRRYDGLSLRDKLGEASTLAGRLAYLDRLIAVADAASYAHANGVIHRDIKPHNIVLGEFGETVLIDWGVAKLIGEVASGTPAEHNREGVGIGDDLTTHGTVVGTPGYMSPEQEAGSDLGPASDIYALGACLLELLRGFERDASEALPVNVPTELVAVCRGAMAADPERRMSAAEFADDLRRFQAGAMLRSYRYSRFERARRLFRRHRVAVATLVAFAVVISTFSLRSWRERAAIERAEATAVVRQDQIAISSARAAVDVDAIAALTHLAALSPDSPQWRNARTISAAAKSRGIRQWIAEVKGARELAWSSDGSIVAVSETHAFRVDSDSGEVESAPLPERHWRVDAKTWIELKQETAFLVRPFEKHERVLVRFSSEPLEISASGTGDVVAARFRDRLRIWQSKEAPKVLTRSVSAEHIAVSHGGASVAYTSDTERPGTTQLSFLDLSSGQERSWPIAGGVRSLAADGDDFVVTSNLGVVARWDPHAGRNTIVTTKVKRGIPHVRGILTAYITEADVLQVRVRWRGSANIVVEQATSLATAAKSPLVVAGSRDGMLSVVWPERQSYRMGVGAAIASVLASDDGERVFALDERGNLWGFDSRQVVGTPLPADDLPSGQSRIGADPSTPRAAAISMAGARLWIATSDGVTETDSAGREVGAVAFDDSDLPIAGLAATNNALAAALSDGERSVIYLSTERGSARRVYAADRVVTAIGFGASERTLLVATDDGQLSRLTLDSKSLEPLGPPLGSISTFSSRGKTIAALSEGTVFVLREGDWVATKPAVSAFALTHSGRTLLLASGAVLTELEIETGEERLVAELLQPANHLELVFDDDAIVAVAVRDAMLIDRATGESRYAFRLSNVLSAVSELPGRSLIATDGRVLVRAPDDLPFGARDLRRWIDAQLRAATPSEATP